MAEPKKSAKKSAIGARAPTDANEKGACIIVYQDGSGDVVPNVTSAECSQIADNRNASGHWVPSSK